MSPLSPPPASLPLSFRAQVITGAGRGRRLGIPTLNVRLADVPQRLPEGIYACRVRIGDEWHSAATHYGPRPVFEDNCSFEVHLLDTVLETAPENVEIEVVAYLRKVLDFPSAEDLTAKIQEDIRQTRKFLAHHQDSSKGTVHPAQ